MRLRESAFALTAVMALALAGCGGGDAPAEPTEPLPSPTLTLTETPTETEPAATATETEAATSAGEVYVVQEGDTLSEIALRFGTTVEAIAEANQLDDPDAITIGQELEIPSG